MPGAAEAHGRDSGPEEQGRQGRGKEWAWADVGLHGWICFAPVTALPDFGLMSCHHQGIRP